MIVYFMGLTDIFAAIMLVTGIRPSIILTFTIAFLSIKSIASFLGRFNPALYILGATDILAVILLWHGMALGYIRSVVLIIMLFKGFISFWKLKLVRDITIIPIYILFKIVNNKLDKHGLKDKISNYLWFGSSKINNGRFVIPESGYPKRDYGYPFLKKFKCNGKKDVFHFKIS